MGDFKFIKRNNKSGDFRSRDRVSDSPPSMHKAVCSQCGKNCEVPFNPSGDRPVYCANCFQHKRRVDDSPRPPQRSFARPSFSDRRPFSPRPFENRTENNSNKEVLSQLMILNEKIDKLILALETKTPKTKTAKKEVEETN